MSDYYELHITFLGADAPSLKAINGWKLSCISGDPDLGPGIRNYLTFHANGLADIGHLVEEMETVADSARAEGFTVVRTKIERVIYDHKTTK